MTCGVSFGSVTDAQACQRRRQLSSKAAMPLHATGIGFAWRHGTSRASRPIAGLDAGAACHLAASRAWRPSAPPALVLAQRQGASRAAVLANLRKEIACVLAHKHGSGTMRQIISYIRVSTGKQGKSGLGIEAQREPSPGLPLRRVSRLRRSLSRWRQERAPTPSTAGRNWPRRWRRHERRRPRRWWRSFAACPAKWRLSPA
jgi:hypothetical protein